jgi:DNA-binding transcriptional regulator YdaS (Cro superfamily)
MRMNTQKSSQIIDRLGGTSEVAKLFGIKPPSVCRWRKSGIPPAREFSLRLMYPELFAPSPK